MYNLFQPAITLMRRLNIAWKFIVLGLLTLFVAIVVLSLLYNSLDEDVHRIQHELDGLEKIETVTRAMQLLQRQRLLSILESSKQESRLWPDNAAKLADTLKKLAQQLPPELRTTEQFIKIEKDWERLARTAPEHSAGMWERKFSEYSKLIAQLRSVEDSIADYYGLSLDPENDSYHLLNIVTTMLPAKLDSLARIRGYGAGILTNTDITPQQYFKMMFLQEQFESELQDFHHAFYDIGKYYPPLQAELEKANADIQHALDNVLTIFKENTSDGRLKLSPEDFMEASTIVVDKLYDLTYNSFLPAAKATLEKRIRQKYWILILSISLVMLLFLLFIYMGVGSYLAISGSIRKLANSATIFANGNLQHRVDIQSQDELKQLGQRFNEMAESFSALYNDLNNSKLTLSQSEARTRAILRSLRDGVIQIDASGKILSINESIETLFGYEDEELIGQSIGLLMPEPHRSNHNAYLQRYRETRQSKFLGQRQEVEGLRHDGTILPMELTANELIDDAGSTFIGVLRDISKQKAIEAEREAARIETERLAQIKGEFLANMSHEIRTPLNAVIGLARIGLRNNAGRATSKNYEQILASGEHLLGVINDILDFSKISAGKLVTEKLPFVLADVVAEAITMISTNAAAKGLKLEYSVPPDPAIVTGDALRLRQILTNLLSNALKFTAQGSITLKVSHDGKTAIFQISDSGIGMTEEQCARLFAAFEQADGSITRKYGGTGLGLAITRQLAGLMGGNISVESRLGTGSTFTVSLPLPPAEAIKTPGKTAIPESRHLTGLRVLAAEDVELNRVVLEDLLEQEGMKVTFAHDGSQVLDLIEQYGAANFDLVLMDIQMPVMDGLEATRRLRIIAPELPVIGISAHALAEERQQSLNAGMVAHITKPIDRNALFTAILDHTESRKNIDTPDEIASDEVAPDEITPNKITTDAKAPDHEVPDNPAAPPGATPSESNSLVDWNALLEQYKGRHAFILKMIDIALKAHNDLPTKLRDAAQSQDFDAVAFIAHSIKGIGANFIALPLHKLAAQTEAAARARQSDAFTMAGELVDLVGIFMKNLVAWQVEASRTNQS